MTGEEYLAATGGPELKYVRGSPVALNNVVNVVKLLQFFRFRQQNYLARFRIIIIMMFTSVWLEGHSVDLQWIFWTLEVFGIMGHQDTWKALLILCHAV